MKQKAILHICCAPCSTHCIEKLRTENIEPTLYFYNPNIHPKSEYERRLNEARKYAKLVNCELIEDKYNPHFWKKEIKGLENEPEGGKRCVKCFELRLKKTSKQKEDFTTSLTVSRYKDSKKIFIIAKELAEKEGINFIDFDFKKEDGYNKSINLSKENNLYRQDYCGCIYSKRSIVSPKE